MSYRVRAGDRLSNIAASTGVSASELLRANPHKSTRMLASGLEVFDALDEGEILAFPPGTYARADNGLLEQSRRRVDAYVARALGETGQAMPDHASCASSATYNDTGGLCHDIAAQTTAPPSCDVGLKWDAASKSCQNPFQISILPGGNVGPPVCLPHSHSDGLGGCACDSGYGGWLSYVNGVEVLSCLAPPEGCARMGGAWDAATGCTGPTICDGHGKKTFVNDPLGMGCECEAGYVPTPNTGAGCVLATAVASAKTKTMIFRGLAIAAVALAGGGVVYLATRPHEPAKESA